jgi:hypothetical protein
VIEKERTNGIEREIRNVIARERDPPMKDVDDVVVVVVVEDDLDDGHWLP